MPEIVQERLRGPNLQAPIPGNAFTLISQINSMDQLVSEFKKMTAHIADMDNRIKARQEYGPAKYFATESKRTPSMPCPNCGGAHWKNECQFAPRTTRCKRCGKPGHWVKDYTESDPRTCIKCNEKGHIARDCKTESRKIPNGQFNTIQFTPEPEPIIMLPAQKREPRRLRRGATPYAPPPPQKKPRARIIEEEDSEEEQVEDPEFERAVQQLIEEDATPDLEMIQAPVHKTRRSKIYQYDAGKDLLERQMNMTFAQGCEISPAIKQQVHRAIRSIKPEYEIREINTVRWKGPSKSSTYTHCMIEEIRTPCIVDTGAAGCIISKTLLDRIGWGIEEAANQKISVAVGPDHLPLGMIFDLPI